MPRTIITGFRNRVESLWSRLVYYWLGPTTVHYRLEAALLSCLTLATVSNLQSVTPLGHAWTWDGDGAYALVVFLWLSRHLMHRWLCLWDPTATLRTPTLLGCASLFLTSHASPGHTYDRPTQAALNFIFTGSTVGGTTTTNASSNSNSGGGPIRLVHLLPTGWKYVVHWVLNWCWYPFLRPILGPALSAVTSVTSNIPSDLVSFVEDGTGWKVGARLGAWREATYALLLQYGPTVPFVLPHAVILLYGVHWHSVLYSTQYGPAASLPLFSTLPSLDKRTAAAIQAEQDAAARAFGAGGANVRVTPPSWGHVILVVATAGVGAGLWTSFWYRRVVAPMPDQVVGTGMAQELQHDARAAASSSSGGGSGIGGGGNTAGGVGSGVGSGKLGGSSASKAAAAAKTREQELLTSWPERARPLEGRVRLERNVRVLRWVEAVLLCGILPRTKWLCRATGHCPPPRLWELSRVLYPIGVSTPLRKDGVQPAALFVGGWVSAVWILLSITILVHVLLLAHSVILNKTYLATVAYVSNEWDPVEEEVGTPSSSSAAQAASAEPSPPAWDPRRRYKKGDRVTYYPAATGSRRAVYRAAVNAPMDPPRPEGPTTTTTTCSTALQLLTCTNALHMEREVGHPLTSALLWKLSGLQCCVAALEFVVVVVRTIRARSVDNGGATALLFAHLIAAHGLASIGAPSYSRLARLGNEIRPIEGTTVA
jgi:hypothetical protein